jgi:cytochrome c oxidase subunit 2
METSFFVMLFVFAVVAAGLIIIIVRDRAKPEQKEPPPQVEGNHRLELAWTIGPLVLVIFLSIGVVTQGFALSGPNRSPRSLNVDVTGHQFWWAFDYPSLGVVTANELHIPTGRPINIVLTSVDVIHSFWIPRLGGKLDAVPGRTNTMWIEATKPGIYPGECAEFCGTGHAYMRMEVDAQTPAQFDAWVRQMQHPQSMPQTALAKKGYTVFSSVGCIACHSIDGTPYTSGTIGPNLTDLSDRQGIAAFTLKNTPANLARWLHDPQAVKPGALMPNLHLSQPEIHALVAYLEGLK